MLAPAKNISWSYSKIKNYELCPRKHYECDIKKNFKDTSEALVEGEKVHRAFEDALKRNKPLPPSMHMYEKWVKRVRSVPGELLVEQKYALTKDLAPTAWDNWDGAWYRGVADAVTLGDGIKSSAKAAQAWDWKTGKRPKIPDELQLALMAWCIVTHYPKIQQVVASFIYLKDDSDVTEIYTRPQLVELWNDFMPRVSKYIEAVRGEIFPAVPGNLCARYCPVTTCPHNGKR